jgi:hypothetical protein
VISTTNLFIPAPDALPLPAPAPLLQALLLLTFTLHLVAMNALVGGSALALWLRRPGAHRRGDDPLTAALIGKALPVCVAAAVSLGVAPLLFLQVLYGRWFFTSSVLMAWPWFAVVPLLILAYYGTYLESFRGKHLGRMRTPLAAATTAIFLLIALIYVNNTTLMIRPESWARLHFGNPGGLQWHSQEPQLLPRWLHLMVGAVSVAGWLLALWGQQRRVADGPGGRRLRQLGLSALWNGTLVNILAGTWILLALAPDVRSAFLGGSPHATGLLGLGVTLTALLLLAVRRAGRHDARSLVPVTVAAALSLVVMVAMRDAVRGLYLARHGNVPAAVVSTQGLNIALFAALLAGGVAVVWWMMRQLARPAV